MKKMLSLFLSVTMLLGISACGAAAPTPAPAPEPAPVESAAPDAPAESASPAAEPVTLKIFSNLPDRTTGQGLLEQKIMDAYVAANPHVTIELEALQDEPYKTKFTAYTASNTLPDILSVWGQPAFIDPVINSGYLAELNPADYADYGFLPGSTDGFSKDGKLYGLPRNTDIAVIFYNKQIFADNGLSVPATMEDLYKVVDTLNAAGVAPMSIAGQDKWPISIMYTDFVMKSTGDNTLVGKAIAAKDFSDPKMIAAAEEMKALVDKGLFQTSFLSADYGASRNLFAQGKSGMFYMGSWEMSMVTDQAIDEAVRSQIGVFQLPLTAASTAQANDLSAWNGGGHSVAANSPVKEEAIKFLNYMYQPENWAQGAWDLGICIPAQNFELTGQETDVQKTLVDMFTNASNISGTPINDMGTPTFKTESENLSQEFAADMIDVNGFLRGLQTSLQNQ